MPMRARYADVVLADQPLAYFRLADTSDTSGHIASGVVGGATTLGVAGLLAGDDNTAASFDGSTSYISFGDDPQLRLTAALTLEAWILPTRFDQPNGAPYPRMSTRASRATRATH